MSRGYRGIREVRSPFVLAGDRRSQSSMSRGRRLIGRDFPDRSIPRPSLRPPRGTPRHPTNNTPGALLMRYPTGRISTIHVTGSPPVFIPSVANVVPTTYGATISMLPRVRAHDIQDIPGDPRERIAQSKITRRLRCVFVKDTSFLRDNDWLRLDEAED